jgi:exopolysaccharide biosynthesis polyprenyl glycosylphosphotransferase
VPVSVSLEDAGPAPLDHGAAASLPLAATPGRLGSRVVAECGRAIVIWLAVGVVAAAERPLSAEGALSVTVAAALWLACLRAAFAGMPYALGFRLPAAVGTLGGLLVVGALAPYLPGAPLTLATLLLAAFGVFLSTALWESIVQRVTARRRVLVVGPTAFTEIAAEARRGGRDRFEVIGAPRELPGEYEAVLPFHAAVEDLAEIVRAQQPELIVLADEQVSAAALDRLLEISNGRFRVAGVTSFYEYAFGCVPLSHLTPMWFLSLLHVRQRPHGRWSKRLFDIVVAGAGLIVTAPLFLVIAVAVKMTRGPVIYRQIRVGEAGRRFTIYKFRTMVDAAERPGEAVWAQHRDPRITRVGRLLRHTHLDELPQLWNVLKGDMSIVGPRPERPELITKLELDVPFWTRRLLIKPGVTGWAQVSFGYAGDPVSAAEKLSYDIWYLRHRNFAVDLAVCARTVLLMLGLADTVRSRERSG